MQYEVEGDPYAFGSGRALWCMFTKLRSDALEKFRGGLGV